MPPNIPAASSSGSSDRNATKPTFIDVFAGCGGLSLGLMNAGWEGLFAVEKDRFAFATLEANLMKRTDGPSFAWPDWLPRAPHCISSLLAEQEQLLSSLAGTIDLLAGGPPCQGFSSAGRRNATDPRNALMLGYLDLVKLIKPRSLLIENVRGMTVDFPNREFGGDTINYSSLLISSLTSDYNVYSRLIKVSDYGVPQGRTRFFLLAIRKDIAHEPHDPFLLLDSFRSTFLKTKGLTAPVNAADALSDLEVKRNGSRPSEECPGFRAIGYHNPLTPFQKLMRGEMTGAPTDTRLANHRPDIVDRFTKIIEQCHAEGRLNTSISKEMRENFGLKKLALRVLDPNSPSPTVTSMPDDLLHYSEPRTLTVRENARLQSFPDWFQFHGKYTTGGILRKQEVPRFTQVANAVPPLMAEALGHILATWLESGSTSEAVATAPREKDAHTSTQIQPATID